MQEKSIYFKQKKVKCFFPPSHTHANNFLSLHEALVQLQGEVESDFQGDEKFY